MIDAQACSSCGAPFSNQAPEGFCPACMLEGALELGHAMVDAPSPVSGLPQLGDYQLLAEIARGGMGVVYRARQLSLDRVVAVKLILIGQFADKSVIKRFKAEAAAAARLRHPHIVAIHEIGEEKGQHFFSMEYIEGKNLAEFIRQEPLTIRQSAQLVAEVAAAVQFAHEHGIVHRDLKPSNILMDPLLEPRITDFGLARDLQCDHELTLTGQVLGSPNYISPEQASGRPSAAAGDVYSLGAILYQLLTGRPPFAAETLTATLQQVTTADPVSPRMLNPSVPRDLETICLKCLEKEPEKRYPAAAALAAELHRFLNDEPIHARPISPPAKAWRWCHRKPVVAGLTAAFAISLFLGFVGILSQWQRAERNLYFSTMRQVQNRLEQESIGHARELLANYIPKWWSRDLRGWEWYYAWDQCKSDEIFSLDHEFPIYSVAMSPDGSLLSAGGGGPVMLWDVQKRQIVKKMFPGQSVSSLIFSNDGNEIIAGTTDGRLLVWKHQKGTNAITMHTDISNVRSMRLSPDGKFLAIYRSEGLSLGSAATYEVFATFPQTEGRDNAPGGIAFSPDSRFLAYGREGGVIALWDIEKATETAIFEGHEQNVTSLEFSPDGSLLISGSRDRTIRVWALNSGREVKRIGEFTAFVTSLDLSPDGQFLAVVGASQYTPVFETLSWRRIGALKGRAARSRCVIFSADGSNVLTGDVNGAVKCWATPIDSVLNSQRLPGTYSELLQGGTGLYLQHTNGTYSLWQTEGHQTNSPKPFPLQASGPQTLSPDGRFWAIAKRGEVKLFDHTTHKLLLDLPTTDAECWNMAFSGDGRLLAVRDANNACRVWRIEPPQGATRAHGSLLGTFQLRTNNISNIKFSPQGRRFGVAYENFEIAEIWTIASRKKVEIKVPGGSTTDIAFSRDESMAVGSCGGGALAVWNPRTGQMTAALGGQLGTLWSVAFSPDETRIAACGGDGTVRLWDRETLQEVATLKLHDGILWQLAFSATGETLFVRGTDTLGEHRLFRLRAPRSLGRNGRSERAAFQHKG